ncbi:MAG: EamA family transporter [Rhodanobacteraceae bacterium]|nr:MAG: EamA family transporter [Rhodanobacteraceae bacterium]
MSRPRAQERAAWIGLVVVTVIWSFGWTTMKVATRYSGPFTFSAQRWVIGTLVLFAWMALRRQPLRPPPWIPTLLIGLTQTAAFQALEQWALMSGGAGRTALLAYTMPFWVVPLAWWWLRDPPGPRRLLCIAAAAVGFVCVVEPWKPLGAPESILLAVLGGLAWAVGAVLSKRVFMRHPEVTPLQLTTWQMLVGAIASVALAVSVHERAVEWTGAYVGALFYNSVLSSSVGWAIWSLVVQRLPAQVAGLTSLVVPIGVVLLAWGLLGEVPSGAEWFGVALIGAALLGLNVWVRWGEAAREPAQPQ